MEKNIEELAEYLYKKYEVTNGNLAGDIASDPHLQALIAKAAGKVMVDKTTAETTVSQLKEWYGKEHNDLERLTIGCCIEALEEAK